MPIECVFGFPYCNAVSSRNISSEAPRQIVICPVPKQGLARLAVEELLVAEWGNCELHGRVLQCTRCDLRVICG
jgi:hypothetical protein